MARPLRVLLVSVVVVATGCGGEKEPVEASEPPRKATESAARAEPDRGPADSGREETTAGDAAAVDVAPAARTEVPDDMLGVPGGAFTMGADDVGEDDEHPAHRVTVEPFLLDRTEVTNRAYAECVEAGACRARKTPCVKGDAIAPEKEFLGGDQPVSCVSQGDAAAFCRWRGRRLPTEAEFERAARGSDGRRFPWGDGMPDERHAVFRGRVTRPVGSCPAGAGPYGHLDMAGNVWEWLADHYDPYAYRRQTADRGVPAECDDVLRTQDTLRARGLEGFTGTNPIPTECEYNLRGGAFNYNGLGMRSSNRVHHPGDWRIIMAGFRCAADWPGGPVE